MDDELEGCLADARIAISAAHDHLTRIEERARKVRAEIETTVCAAVQWEMRERIATAERERDAALASLAEERGHFEGTVKVVWQPINTRRIALIEREARGVITPQESAELEHLQAAADAIVRPAIRASIRALLLDAAPVAELAEARAVAEEREACAEIARAAREPREARLRRLEREGIDTHDPARLALIVAITDAERIEAEIRARGNA